MNKLVRPMVLMLVLGVGVSWSQTGVLDEMAGELVENFLPECACFDFDEGTSQEWQSIGLSEGQANTVPCDLFFASSPDTSGDKMLGLDFAFSDHRWSNTGISWAGPVDLQNYESIAVDLYLPEEIRGRQVSARFIMKVGEKWEWCQAKKGTPLVAEEWVTMTMPLDDLSVVRFQVQSMMIRIEGAALKNAKPLAVSAKIYLDNIRLR